MRPGSPELAAALAAGERVYDLQVRLGSQDVTDEVASWSVSRGSDTGLPEQVATPTGSSAAETQLSLVGQGSQTAAARYSPWAPRVTADIARPGQSCVLEWGVGAERMQAMRGRVRSVSVNARSGQAQLRALDGAELLRGQAWLPPGVIAGADGYIHTQWAIDHALRMSGIYTSPPARAGAIFFASLQGSREANIGMRQSQSGSVGYYPDRSPWTAGPAWSSVNEYSSWSATYSPQKRVISQVNTLMVEWWFSRRTLFDNPTSQIRLVYADRPSAEAGRVETTVTCSYDPALRRLSVQTGADTTVGINWNLPATVDQVGRFKVAFRLSFSTTSAPITAQGHLYQPNGALYTSSSWSGHNPTWGVLETVELSATGPMECAGVSVVSGTVPIVEPWRRGAQIDLIGPGGVGSGSVRYALRVLPDASGSWWDLLKQIAADNLSYMWFDEDGYFRFRPYDYVTPTLAIPTPDLTVTAARDIADLAVSEESDGIANRVEVGVTSYSAGAGQTQQYDYTAVLTIPGSSSTDLRFDFQGRPWQLRPPMYFAGSTIPAGTLGSLVKFMTTAGSRSPVEIELSWDTGWPVMTFTNRSTSTTYSALTSAVNTPSLRLAHSVATQTTHQPVSRQNTDSIARFGVQALEVSTSPWVQSPFWADGLALALIAWTAWPVPMTGAVEVLPDPRIQIGDVVHIVDRDGTRIDHLYRVLGYTVRGTGPDVRMSLDVRPLARPAQPVDGGTIITEPVLDPTVAVEFPG